MFSKSAIGVPRPQVNTEAASTPGRKCGALRRALPWLIGVLGFFAPLTDASAQISWNPSRQYDDSAYDDAIAMSGTTIVAVYNRSTGLGNGLEYRIADLVGSSGAAARYNPDHSIGNHYDNGFNPAVAVSGTTVVEIHDANQGAGPMWYHVGVIGTGPLINWRSNAATKLDFNGFRPSVALAGNVVVEAHNEAGTGKLAYTIGDVDTFVGIIRWRSGPQVYDSGTNPAIAVVGQGNSLGVVEVHNGGMPGPNGNVQLWYRVGFIDGATIAWRQLPHRDGPHSNGCINALSCQYDIGFNPKISLTHGEGASSGTVIEVHNGVRAPPGGIAPLWYNFGEVDLHPMAIPAGDALIEWNGALPFGESGFNPSVASMVPSFNPTDLVTAITTHGGQNAEQGGPGQLWFRVGPMAGRERVMSINGAAAESCCTWEHWVGAFCLIYPSPPYPLDPDLDAQGVAVGFRDYYGNCGEKWEELARASVQFPLDNLDKVDLALLTFDMTGAKQLGGTGRGAPCAATVLGMAKQANPIWDFDFPVPLPSGCTAAPFTYAMRVEPQVTQWLEHVHPNAGFVLAGPRLTLPDDASDLPTDNDFNGSAYANFKLQIWYNRLLNRNAPQ